ncbi:response regulator [Virgibacillus oceani]|uniref:DNA-binding response regulator n=1 Tax=Virgibacillus oceani TaxID=1479511 RepID=A0A917HCG8_9BACI|nr:response regulator transcription factor [Virgibacillus oceani]GGG74451.1 DNA-binding response regulator [Virgibacillus oceani]
MDAIRIAIADDHPIIRDGFETILMLQDDFNVIGTASNGKEAIQLARLDPDVILMDVQMPVLSGVEATRIIKDKHPGIYILMLTSHTNGHDVMEAISNGASGFLLKDWETEKIITSIKDALTGKMQIPQTAASSIKELLHSWHNENLHDKAWNKFGLSEREMEIANLLVQGFRNAEIARKLFLSIGTVKNYTSSLYKKLEVRTRREAIIRLKNEN